MRPAVGTTNHLPGTPPEWSPPPGTPAPGPAPERQPSLPMILTTSLAPDPVRSELLRRRIIVATGPLDDAAAEQVSAELVLLDNENQDEITLHLASRDAGIDAALTLIATIDLIAAPVHAIATGSVEGAAVAVFAAADRRTAHPHAAFILRQPKAGFDGDAESLRVAADAHQRDLATICGRIAATTGRAPDEVAEDLRRGRLLTVADAEDYGLISPDGSGSDG